MENKAKEVTLSTQNEWGLENPASITFPEPELRRLIPGTDERSNFTGKPGHTLDILWRGAITKGAFRPGEILTWYSKAVNGSWDIG